ncbi:MAG: GlsB/YeaQ/YmgE family stress response membrane protein [Gammaproteobacteria bacterium]
MVIGILILAVIGGIIGWLASLLVRGTGLGLFGDIIVGIIGANLGGWLFGTLGISLGNELLTAFVAAISGAVIILLIIRLIKRA